MNTYETAKVEIERLLSEPWASESLRRGAQQWWDGMKEKIEGTKPTDRSSESQKDSLTNPTAAVI